MSTRLMVNQSSELQEFRETSHQPQNIAIRLAAKVISYIFHPLFVPVYIAWFLITVQPYLIASFTPSEKFIFLLRFILQVVAVVQSMKALPVQPLLHMGRPFSTVWLKPRKMQKKISRENPLVKDFSSFRWSLNNTTIFR